MNAVYQERFTEISGAKICYVDEGKGTAILLVHGLGGSLSNWVPTIEFLKRDYRVIALDMPCFGKSDFIETDLTPDFFSQTILSLLDQLEVENIIAAGHSMGGVVVLNLALFHREILNGLVLVDAAGNHRVPSPVLSILSSITGAENADKMSRFALNLESMGKKVKSEFIQRLSGVRHPTEYTREMIADGIFLLEGRDVKEQVRAVFRSGRETLSVSYASMLGQIDVPTLIVWGQKDPFMSFKAGQRFNIKIKGSVLAVIPESGHIVQLEQPDLFNDALRTFLAGASG